MHKPQMVPVPEPIRRNWAAIRRAMGEIAGWAEGYSHGYIDLEGSLEDVPEELPDAVPLIPSGMYDLDEIEGIDPDKRLYLANRDFGKEWSGRTIEETQELSVGTFCVFRLPTPDVEAINAEYGGELSENERQLVDDKHTIVVYMI